MKQLNENVFFVRAKLKNDYVYNGIADNGFDICTPFYGNILPLRVLREIWFHMKLPFCSIWFNKDVLKTDKKVIIIRDPLITQEYIVWIRSKMPDSIIIVDYENRADKTINPNAIKTYVNEIWSYDKTDCEKYNMTYKHFSFDEQGYKNIKRDPRYDVLFVGRDKGRAETIFALQRRFESYGLRTYIYICADRSFLRFKKPFYRKVLNYDEYLELVGKSRAILNIMPEDQTSITQRDIESVVYGIKEITNNKGIRAFEFYDPSRFFIIGEDEYNILKPFILSEYPKVKENDIKKYKESTILHKLLDSYIR